MIEDVDEVTDLRELELKIKEGERLLLEAKGFKVLGFWPLVIALVIVVSMGIKIPRGGPPYVLLTLAGLAYVCFSLWRIYGADKKVKQYEAKLKEYQGRKEELQSLQRIKK